MLGKILCVLGDVVLGYVAREEINKAVENVMEVFSGQSSSGCVNECSVESEERHSDEHGDERNENESSPSIA